MKTLLLTLLVALPFCPARAAEPLWLTYDGALLEARTDHLSVLVLYGREGCPYVQPAKTALAASSVTAVTDGVYARAYVDINASKAIADRWHIVGTPTLQFLGQNGEEVWRLTPTGKPDELRKAIQEVLTGKSYERQARLLREGLLDSDGIIELARTYLDRGWSRRGGRLLRNIVDDTGRHSASTRRVASFYLMEYATPKQRLRLLPRHIARFPDDLLARLNLGYATRNKSLKTRREVLRQIADALPLSQDPDLTSAGLQLVVQYAVYSDPTSATWALPYALERLRSNPSDLEALAELTAIAILADQRDVIAEAQLLVVAANAPTNAVGDAIAEGTKLAAKSAPSGSPR